MSFNNENMNIAFGWDDTIETENEYSSVILKEGDYNFTVTGFERKQHNGSAKIAPCPKAELTLQADSDQGVATAKTTLFLNRSQEWKVCSFFRSIGQKKHGEPLKPNWNAVMGAQGRAHIAPRTYTNSSGDTREVNDVKYFIDYNEDNLKNMKPGAKFTQLEDDGDIPF